MNSVLIFGLSGQVADVAGAVFKAMELVGSHRLILNLLGGEPTKALT